MMSEPLSPTFHKNIGIKKFLPLLRHFTIIRFSNYILAPFSKAFVLCGLTSWKIG